MERMWNKFCLFLKHLRNGRLRPLSESVHDVQVTELEYEHSQDFLVRSKAFGNSPPEDAYVVAVELVKCESLDAMFFRRQSRECLLNVQSIV